MLRALPAFGSTPHTLSRPPLPILAFLHTSATINPQLTAHLSAGREGQSRLIPFTICNSLRHFGCHCAAQFKPFYRSWLRHDAIKRSTFWGNTTVASGGRDNLIKLWDVTGGGHRDLRGHINWVLSVAFSGDGRYLASGSRDTTVKLWNVKSARLRETLSGHSNWVMCVTFATDGETLVSGSTDRTLKLWDAASGNLRVTLTGQMGGVFSAAFSPIGSTFASGDNKNTIRLWRAATKSDVDERGAL
jgi:WD40 repeat protein